MQPCPLKQGLFGHKGVLLFTGLRTIIISLICQAPLERSAFCNEGAAYRIAMQIASKLGFLIRIGRGRVTSVAVQQCSKAFRQYPDHGSENRDQDYCEQHVENQSEHYLGRSAHASQSSALFLLLLFRWCFVGALGLVGRVDFGAELSQHVLR